MADTFRALCSELNDAYLRVLEHVNSSTWLGYEPSDDPLVVRATAALASNPQVRVTDEELLKTYQRAVSAKVESIIQAQGDYTGSIHEHAVVTLAGLHAVLARCAPHPRPIPVAERLPTKADCDAEGRCWWWVAEWRIWDLNSDRSNHPRLGSSFWLPASAIPLPQQENTDA